MHLVRAKLRDTRLRWRFKPDILSVPDVLMQLLLVYLPPRWLLPVASEGEGVYVVLSLVVRLLSAGLRWPPRPDGHLPYVVVLPVVRLSVVVRLVPFLD